MAALQVARLESLILDKICRLSYVRRVAYSDDGQEVTILVFHDYDSARDGAMVLEIGRAGREIWDEMPDRMISPLAIDDGPDLPDDALFGCKPFYVRRAPQ